MPLKQSYTRRQGITEREIDDVIFLVNPDTDALYHLNPVGAALWRLLKDRTSGKEAADLICKAFPDADPTTVKTDIVKLMAEFFDHQLITIAEE
ncbi:MAG: PqqD family protein [Rhodospirillaceae bacterium]|nr:PqqD family protein [Rhodospirillaceae bacterium]